MHSNEETVVQDRKIEELRSAVDDEAPVAAIDFGEEESEAENEIQESQDKERTEVEARPAQDLNLQVCFMF